MSTVREDLAEALELLVQRTHHSMECVEEAIARHEREPEDQDAAVVQARANAFEEAARIAEAMVGPPLGKLAHCEAIAAAIRARAQEVKP